MEMYFSRNAALSAAQYVCKNYPGVKVGLIGAGETEERLLNRTGNPTSCGEEAFSEDARLYMGCGTGRAYYEARAAAGDCDHILSVTSDIGAALSEYSIIGFRKMKYKYPKAVFFTIDENDESLGAEAYAFLTKVYAELLDVGLKSMYYAESVRARELIPRAKELLMDPGDVEKMIRSGFELRREAGVAGGFFDFADRLCPEGAEGLHHRFLCYYISLMLGIRFTKFPFRSILLGKDEVRARIIMESAGVPRPKESRAAYTEPATTQALKYLPSADELTAIAEGFFPAAGKKALSPLLILNNLSVAASLTEERGFQSVLADSGFTDAVADAL